MKSRDFQLTIMIERSIGPSESAGSGDLFPDCTSKRNLSKLLIAEISDQGCVTDLVYALHVSHAVTREQANGVNKVRLDKHSPETLQDHKGWMISRNVVPEPILERISPDTVGGTGGPQMV